MTRLFIPESARPFIERDRAEIATQFQQLRGVLDHYNRELYQIDPRLRLVKAHDGLPPDSALKAGYYHLILDAPGHPSTVLPLEHDDGTYREPGSWIYPYLEEQDMWNDRARHASRKRQESLRRAAERERERESQARIEEFNERWKAANSTQILVKRSIT